ncbi:MAG: hypothetical protein HQL95_06320 [Magnetococcales bacterium]|nr:hypothetical protein [Magnetococcales bacterium]
MELIYFTVIGGALYLLSERLLNRIEASRGARLPYRSLIFFLIIFALTMATFSGIRVLTDSPREQTPQAAGQDATPPKTPEKPPAN